jgi:large subunit ribosomal protein L7/L12
VNQNNMAEEEKKAPAEEAKPTPAETPAEKPKEEKPAEKPAEEKKEEPKEAAPQKAAKEEKVEVPAKFKKLVEEIEKMSVLDLAELVKLLEKKFGVSAAAPVAVAAPAAGGAAAPAVEEKSVYNIELTAVGAKKIEVIKAVRDTTEKGLKEAKDLVDAAATGPQMVKENVKKEDAEEIKKKFEAAGAKVELK